MSSLSKQLEDLSLKNEPHSSRNRGQGRGQILRRGQRESQRTPSVGQIVPSHYLQLRVRYIRPDNTLYFTADGNEESVLYCKIDVEGSLSKNECWWKLNQKLLKGRDDLILPVIIEFLKTYKLETDLPLHLKDLKQVQGDQLCMLIKLDILKTYEDEKLFEKLIAKNSVQVLEEDKVMSAKLKRIDQNGDVFLELETSFASSIQEMLNYRKQPNLVDARDTVHRRLFKLYYEKFNVRTFNAPINDDWNNLHRVEILKEIFDEDKKLFKFEVSYLDLGITTKVPKDEFASMTRKSVLPSLLDKLPAQIYKAHLNNVGESIHAPFKYMGILDEMVTVKLIEKPCWSNRYMNMVDIFMENLNERFPNPLEWPFPNDSLNEYLLFEVERNKNSVNPGTLRGVSEEQLKKFKQQYLLTCHPSERTRAPDDTYENLFKDG